MKIHLSGEVPPQLDRLQLATKCLGERALYKPLEAVLETLPVGTSQVGFYSYGEISPFVSGPCDLHNQTLTLTTITERAA